MFDEFKKVKYVKERFEESSSKSRDFFGKLS